MKIKPFRAVRYNQKKVPLDKVVAPPYDVISPERQEELYELNPYNIVRLILGKEHANDDISDNRYTRAAADFRSWLNTGILDEDDKESFYLYEQTFTWEGSTYIRTGVLARAELRQFGDGIYPHEKTMSKAKEDRYKLTAAAKANFSPIFSLYETKNKNIADLFTDLKKRPVDINIVDDRGVGDKLWVIDDSAMVNQIRSCIEGNDIFIADGHHRYETALKYSKDHPDMEGAKYVLMMLIEMSDEGLVILPAHRVAALGSKTAEEFLGDLKEDFNIEPIEPELDNALNELENVDHNFILLLKNHFYKLSFKDDSKLAENDFDVSILHKYILENILGVDPMKVEDRLYFTKSPEEAFKLAEAPQTAAFFLRPTPLTALKKVAKAHQTMPQKSTYFYPKLLSGLVINDLESV